MEQYMQRVLSFLCPLTKYSEDLSQRFDQHYSVYARDMSKLFKEKETVDDLGRSFAARKTMQIVCEYLGKSEFFFLFTHMIFSL